MKNSITRVILSFHNDCAWLTFTRRNWERYYPYEHHYRVKSSAQLMRIYRVAQSQFSRLLKEGKTC